MKKAVIILIVLIGCNQSTKSKPTQQVEMLKEFYTAYILTCCEAPENVESNKAVKRKYLTEELQRKLVFAYSIGFDYDPFLNAQDCDERTIKTLEITPDINQKNTYTVCYTWPAWNSTAPELICIKLYLKKSQGKYLIDNIIGIDDIIKNIEKE